MTGVTRRIFVSGSMVVLASAGGAGRVLAQDASSFMAASSEAPGAPTGPMSPGLQGITALCEVTGGGQKVYAIAAAYDVQIDPASLSTDNFAAAVAPAATGYVPGMPMVMDKNASDQPPAPRAIAAIYTSDTPYRRLDQTSVPGRFVIAEFAHDPDLSLPTTDSEKVTLVQTRDIRTTAGATYPAADKIWSNAGPRGNAVTIRGVDDWEQGHWWRDDDRATWQEYSIYLPAGFLAPGGDQTSWPLVLAVTHSGTAYDGTTRETLTETVIASIWGMPEEQARNECVVITPRYERTTMNDYWEHTHDVENTMRVVQSLLTNTWNFGNPNLDDRRDKVLKIDPARVYCTGWSMGAMTSMWLMARHPDVFAAGLIIAGQQRPADVAALASQKVLLITGSEDGKATPWNEKTVPVWRAAGGTVVRPDTLLDPALIFPVTDQTALNAQIDAYLAEDANITFLTFKGVDHMGSARKFFYIQSARDWLFRQTRG